MTPEAIPPRQGIRIIEMYQVMHLSDERYAERQGNIPAKRRVKNLDRSLAADCPDASLALEFFNRLDQRIASQPATPGAPKLCPAGEICLQLFKGNFGDE